MKQTYPKQEKLKGKYAIDRLFDKGKWYSCQSLRIKTLLLTNENNFMIGVSVPKRQFKRAVDRNKIKRWLREIYRLNKADFQTILGINSHNMLFYSGKNFPKNFQEIQQNGIDLLDQIKNKKL